MAIDLARIRVAWSGWSGGPGVSTFFADSSKTGYTDALHAFFEGFKNLIPAAVTITVPNQGDLVDDSTGALVGTWGDGSGGVTTGAAAGAMNVAQGVQVRWDTAAIHRGRHLRGRTFLVPFPSDSFGADGLLTPAWVTPIQNAANTLVSAAAHGLVVWGRPQQHIGGTSGPITAGTVLRKPVVLRSRRD